MTVAKIEKGDTKMKLNWKLYNVEVKNIRKISYPVAHHFSLDLRTFPPIINGFIRMTVSHFEILFHATSLRMKHKMMDNYESVRLLSYSHVRGTRQGGFYASH